MENATEELILSALLLHPTVKAAAKAIGLTDRTIYKWLAKPEFKAKYEAKKVEVVRGVTTLLQSHMSDAVNTMADLMADKNGPALVRLNAAKAILEQGDKFTEATDFMRRIEELEAIIAEQEQS